MAKKGMKRVERTHTKLRNEQAAVTEIQGKAKSSKVQARAIIAGTSAPAQKVYHAKPHRVIDNDLARDNLENDIPNADLQDL